MNAWKLVGLMLIFAACKGKPKERLEVSGSVKNFDKLVAMYPQAVKNNSVTLYLYEIPFGSDLQPIQLDSAVVTEKNNNFSMKAIATSTGMYDIMIDQGPLIPLINDQQDIKVDIDVKNKERYYTVNGSAASKQLQDFIVDYSNHSSKFNKSMSALDSLKKLAAPDSLIISATNQKNAHQETLNSFLKNFLRTSNQSIVSSFALGRASQTLPRAEFESEMNALVTKYPQEQSLISMKRQYDQFKLEETENERRMSAGNWLGKKAPELILPDVNGKNISLSSFKGKYVLVDFWASWCGPCRLENPNVVAAYNQFKNKNFTILGVSLDKTKDAWVGAIQEDGLAWTHVSDLAFWNSISVKTFGFGSIPFNVLIDPQGNVVAQGLRGEQLHAKLAELLP